MHRPDAATAVRVASSTPPPDVPPQGRPRLPRGNDTALRGFLIAGYVFMLPVQFALGPDLRLAPSDLFVAAYLVVSSFRLRSMSGAWTVWYPALLVLLGVGMLVSLGTIHSVTSYAIGQKAGGLLILMLSMACVVDHCTSLDRIRRLLGVFLAGVLVNVVLSLGVYAVQQGNPAAFPQINYDATRVSGFLIDPNAFGGLVACALVIHLFTARTPAAVVPASLRVVTTLLLSTALVLTFSRSAWIAVSLGILVALMAAGRVAARAVVPLIAGLAIAVPLLAVRYVPNLEALASRPNQIGDRVSIIGQALNEYVASPVWGVGLGVFPVRHEIIVHNTTLWFLAEMGLIGLVVFVGFVTSFARRMVLLRGSAGEAVRAFALAMLAAHAAMLGLSVGIEALYQRQWWLVFAVGGALMILPRSSSPTDATTSTTSTTSTTTIRTTPMTPSGRTHDR